MTEPPRFWCPEVAATFGDEAVASSYRHRPFYPPEVFAALLRLIRDEPRAVLDLGCGTGFVARPLAPSVDRVDAVDVSAAMVQEGKRLPGGDDPRIQWIVGPAERVILTPPYALVTAGDSLHWMDWSIVLPRIADALTPHGSFAILTVDGSLADADLREGVVALIKRYSTLGEWAPGFDMVAELQRRGLFAEVGRMQTAAEPFRQSLDDYIESFHARASLSWDRMTAEALREFDADMRQLLAPRLGDTVELAVRSGVVWGKPLHAPVVDEGRV